VHAQPALHARRAASRPGRVAPLNDEIGKALAASSLKSPFAAEGAEAARLPPTEFGAMIAGEIARWKPVIERAGMRPE
jgi:tripartite-type tricarboxylate transporter receptor subunit TctC